MVHGQLKSSPYNSKASNKGLLTGLALRQTRTLIRKAGHGRYPGPFEDLGTHMLKAPKLLLNDAERQRLDESPDANFYITPRMMQHADDEYINALSSLYGSIIPAGSCVLELCASAHSHLPEDLHLRLVVGQGMNRQELAANPRLHQHFVQDLNLQPLLQEQLDSSYDVVLCANGIQYLTQPETVIAEASRMLRPGGVLVVAFGRHCFREKALAGWLSRDARGRSQLLQTIIQANGFEAPLVLDSPTAAATAGLGPAQRQQQQQQQQQLGTIPVHHPSQVSHAPHSYQELASSTTAAAGHVAATAAASDPAQGVQNSAGCELYVLVARKSNDWTAGAAEADLVPGPDMRPDNVEAWFTKPGLAGLAEAATAQNTQPASSQHVTQQPSNSSNPSGADTSTHGHGPAPSNTSSTSKTSVGPAVVNERLMEQWHAAYESLVIDAVDLGIPRSVIPTVKPDATPAELQDAVEHLQAMMASFLSAGL